MRELLDLPTHTKQKQQRPGARCPVTSSGFFGRTFEEVVFEVVGREVVVMDTVLADAIHGLSKCDQAIVLLYYFAEWTDRRIAEELGCPRSTVQFRRSKALLALRARLEEVIGDDEL